MTIRITAFLMLLATAPLSAQQGVSAGEAVKAMTAEERAKAQRDLNEAAAIFYDGPIDSVKAQLRRVMVIMRDSVLAVEAESARLQRATSEAVVNATARRLGARCSAAARTALLTRAKIQPLETSAAFGNEVLKEYRATLTEVTGVMTACDKTLGGGALSAPARKDAVAKASAVSQRYEMASDALLRALEIPLRPKGVPGGG